MSDPDKLCLDDRLSLKDLRAHIGVHVEPALEALRDALEPLGELQAFHQSGHDHRARVGAVRRAIRDTGGMSLMRSALLDDDEDGGGGEEDVDATDAASQVREFKERMLARSLQVSLRLLEGPPTVANDAEGGRGADEPGTDLPGTTHQMSAAQGWVHRLDNRGEAGLWGLTEWLTDYVRDGIRNGQFRYLSPAIRFGSKDPVSGKPAGARLTSVGITNAPFLHLLPGLVAASDEAPRVRTPKPADDRQSDLFPTLASGGTR